MAKKKVKYVLGNILRGYVYGDFSSDDEAWKKLSKQFDAMFPSQNGRDVHMHKEIFVKRGYTPGKQGSQ